MNEAVLLGVVFTIAGLLTITFIIALIGLVASIEVFKELRRLLN